MNKQDALKEIETIRARLTVLEQIVQPPEEEKLRMPLKGSRYWYIGNDGDVFHSTFVDDHIDHARAVYGNCLPTRETAGRAIPLFARAHKIIQAALQVDADAGAFKYGERNWSVWCRREDGKWVPVPWGCAHSGLPYVHTKEQAERMAAILNAEGV